MQRFTLFYTYLKKKISGYEIFVVLLLALLLRFPNVDQIGCDYLSDCGRDLLAAKHMAEGTASLLTSPASAVPFLPNTPFYYWILAGLYYLGGLSAIAYVNVLAGVIAVWLVYAVVIELTKDKLLSWFAAVFMAVSPEMIGASVSIWQPHWDFLFGGIAILLCLRALRSHDLARHYFAAASLWPLLFLEHLAIPTTALMSVWLIWSEWKITRHQKFSFEKIAVGFSLVVMWIVWITLVLWLKPSKDAISLGSFIGSETFSISTILVKITDLSNIFVHFFSDAPLYYWFWCWLLLIPIVLALYRLQRMHDHHEKLLLGFFLSLLLPLILVCIDPGNRVAGWHFLLQFYVWFLCFILIPYFLRFSQWVKVSFLVILLGTLLFQNRLRLNHTFISQDPSIQQAKKLAKFIATDAQAQGIKPTQFRLAHRDAQVPGWMTGRSGDDLSGLANNYMTAGIQLGLELVDSRYSSRVKVVTLDEWWANYQQPDAYTYYVLCTNFTVKTASSCVEALFSTDLAVVEKTNLGPVFIAPMRPVFIFRLRLRPEKLESNSARYFKELKEERSVSR